MREPIPADFRRKAAYTLVFAFVLSWVASPSVASAQDAMSDRYAAIRAPTEALVARIGQSRLQADLNALLRERRRVQGQLRQTQYLRLQDPVSGLAAAGRVLDSRLDRIGTELRGTRQRLDGLARERQDAAAYPGASLTGRSSEILGSGTIPPELSERQLLGTDDAARAFVEDLLRANRSRQ